MDGQRFDFLVQLLGTARSRRATLGALLGAVLGSVSRESPATKRKRRTKAKGQGQGTNRGKGGAHGKATGKRRRPHARAEAAPARCFTGSPCLPGPGKNLGKCNFADSPTLKNKNLKGANLGSATIARGDASGANLHGANLDMACLVDTILTGAKISGSTNIASAILCRTTMPDGSENNAGCGKGTLCCPTCDAVNPCPSGQACCNGRCRAGECCTVDDCEEQHCQTVQCQNRQCVYDDQPDKQPGTQCDIPRQCCDGLCCADGQVCCDGGCQPGNCCSDDECSGVDPICCGGVCIPGAQCCTNGEPGCPPDLECVDGTCGVATVCTIDDECSGVDPTCCGGACCPGVCQCGSPDPLVALVMEAIASFCDLPFPFCSAAGTGQRCGPGFPACPADTTCLTVSSPVGTIGACAGLCPGADYPPISLSPECAAIAGA